MAFAIHKPLQVACIVLYWAGTVAFLVYLGWKVYGGSLAPFDGLLIIFPPICAVAVLCRSPSPAPKPASRPRVWHLFQVAGWIVLFGLLLASLIGGHRYDVGVYQLLLLLMIFCLLEQRRKRLGRSLSLSRFFLLLFTVYLLVAIGFCAVVRPATVRQGAALVRGQGYTAVGYGGHISDPSFLSSTFSDFMPMTSREQALGLYFYAAQKDGQPYGVLVSVLGNRVVGYTQNQAVIAVFAG